jgi:protein-disulfide isomerase
LLAAPIAADETVAVVAGRPITRAELQTRAKKKLIVALSRAYEAERSALEGVIDELLLENEAAARRLPLAELLKTEIDAKAAPATEWDARRYYEEHPNAFKGQPEAEALRAAETRVKELRHDQRRAGFLAGLRTRTSVELRLAPPRIEVDPGDSASRGTQGAPVTIVAFSDFQCPFCARVVPALKQIEARYKDRVRFVFRHFPLSSHADAAAAAEAAECAREQGKFWEMHDALFAHRDSLKRKDLDRRASELRLDAGAFAACLDSGRNAARWRADKEAGTGYGVEGTPTFFVNGRFMDGAQPFDRFARVIDEELARTKR